ncbi:hypothetical protein PFISCL1PPCAC_23684, partial [Pristionchus fissidentatus]
MSILLLVEGLLCDSPHAVVEIVEIIDSDSLVHRLDFVRAHLHESDGECRRLSLCHYGDDRLCWQIRLELSIGMRQTRTHDAGSIEDEFDGSLVDALPRKHVRVLVQQSECGDVSTVADLDKLHHVVVTSDQFNVILALDELEVFLLGEDIVEIRLDHGVLLEKLLSDAFLHGILELSGARDVLFIVEFLEHRVSE